MARRVNSDFPPLSPALANAPAIPCRKFDRTGDAVVSARFFAFRPLGQKFLLPSSVRQVQNGRQRSNSVNRAFLPPGEQFAASLLPEWRQWLQTWRAAIQQCARKPSRKRVHVLRALTLRLRACMGHTLEQAASPAAERAFQRWNKEAKKLRKALEPVRNADVYLARLNSLRSPSSGAADVIQPPLSPLCAREIAKLENCLMRKRLAEIERLTDFLDARGKRLNRLSKEAEAALEPLWPSKEPSTATAAVELFARLDGELPRLDASNLHEYRKRLKPALYLAEFSAATDPLARRLATAFRKIHNASGEWHDWQALALEANGLLRGHDRQDGLLPVLRAREEQALHRALGQCRRVTARFLAHSRDLQPAPRKKPVAAERGLRLEDIASKTSVCR
jgi:CHAD domain-containing protein